MGSRIDMNAPVKAKLTHRARIDDAEVKTRLGSQRVLPWDLQSERADDKDSSGPVVNHEFQPHHACFNRFAKSYISGDQQVDPWHLDRPDDRTKLIVFDFDRREGHQIPRLGDQQLHRRDGQAAWLHHVDHPRTRTYLHKLPLCSGAADVACVACLLLVVI